jgi:hypothetical protein
LRGHTFTDFNEFFTCHKFLLIDAERCASGAANSRSEAEAVGGRLQAVVRRG